MPATTATLRWTGGLRFEGTGSFGHKIVIDDSRKGGGEESGHKPTELLLWGLAGCTGFDVIGITKKQRQKVTGLEIEVIGHNNTEFPRPFHTIDVIYRFSGEDLDAEKLRHAVELSESKYCTVSQTLQKSAKITTRIEISQKGV